MRVLGYFHSNDVWIKGDGSPPPSSRGQAIREDNEIPRLRFDALEMTLRRG